MTAGTRRKSRLDGIVFFYHTGLEVNYAITGSFKIIPIRFQSMKLARSIPPGWYRLRKRLGNKNAVIRTVDDIDGLTDLELSDIAWRMRVRFGKLVSEVKETKKRRITDSLYIVKFGDVPFVTDHGWFIYAMIDTSMVAVDRMHRSRLYELAKKHKEEYVAVYVSDLYSGVIHFPSVR